MKHYIYFDSQGRITAAKTIQEGMVEQNAAEDEAWIEGDGVDPQPPIEYIVEGVITPRPAMGLTVSSQTATTDESITISGVPVGAVLEHPSGATQVDEDTVEWSSAVPGEFVLRFISFPYLDEEITLEITP